MDWLKAKIRSWICGDFEARLTLAEETIKHLDGFPYADTVARMDMLEKKLEPPEKVVEKPAIPSSPWGCQ